MLKLDFQAGGWGVEQSSSREQTRNAMKRLAQVKYCFHPPLALADDATARSGAIPFLSVQKRVAGRVHEVCLVAIEGEVLASFTFAKWVTTGPTGPSSVVRYVYDAKVDRIARRVVSGPGFIGFCGIEVIVERQTGLPYVLECNPRPAPSSIHGDHLGTDLCRALRAVLGGPRCEARIPSDVDWMVAQIPQEWLRDPNSE
jgi:hypothetical protein